MNNAELFKKVFGIYAEEFWAYPKDEMLNWLTYDATDTNAGDLIRRQAAIEAVRSYYDECDEDERSIEERIADLPTAEPKWIPVTERLPKLGEKVLVSTKNTVFTQVFKCIYGTPDRWGWEHNTIKKVTAWKPLPEPYKEEKNDAEIH